MNGSFTLLSSMSPKLPHFNSKNGNVKTKGVRSLALRKNIRRSQILDQCITRTTANTTIIIIEDSSTETKSSTSKTSNPAPDIDSTIITISDNDKSKLENSGAESSTANRERKSSRDNPFLSKSKFNSIRNWVSKVNTEDNKMTEDASREDLYARFNKTDNQNNYKIGTIRNTKLETEMLNVNSLSNAYNKTEIDLISNSIKTLHIEEYIQADKIASKYLSKEEQESNIAPKHQPNANSSDEDVVEASDDSLIHQTLYGTPLKDLDYTKLRDLRNATLSKSEPHKKRNVNKIYIPPKTEKTKTQTSNFLVSPNIELNKKTSRSISRPDWVQRLQFLCSDDNSSDASENDSISWFSAKGDDKNKLVRSSHDKEIKSVEDAETNLSFTDNTNTCSSNVVKNLFKTHENPEIRKNLFNSSLSNNSDKENYTDSCDNYEPLEIRIKKKIQNVNDKKSSIPVKIQNNFTNKKENKKSTSDDELQDKSNHVKEGEETNTIKKKIISTKRVKKKPKAQKGEHKSHTVNDNSEGNNCKSFLSSLSAIVKNSECDPSARIFRSNFQVYKTKLVIKLFKLFNKNVFDNAIPEDTPLEWSDRLLSTAGHCYCRKITRSTGIVERKVRIVLSSKILDSADRLRDTLIHEMCHAATWIINRISNGHGNYWKQWTIKAREVFPELPPIKRCHEYIINTKYTYKCTNCGYSFGRHSKSLNLERKRCGHCYGKFELLLNKKNKDGETKSVPVTPKKEATGFALFVKENYAIVKTPQMNHGQVMKLLGQKFSEMKVSQ